MKEVNTGLIKPEYLQRAKALADQHTFHRNKAQEAMRAASDNPDRKKEFKDSANRHLGEAVKISGQLNEGSLRPTNVAKMRYKVRNNSEQS